MSPQRKDGPDGQDEEFDAIVEKLDIDLDFPALPGAELGATGAVSADMTSDRSDPRDEQFYRRVPARDPQPADPRRTLAVVALIGAPTLLVASSMLAIVLNRAVFFGLGLTFVAAAVYLISRLPERGPAHPDSPDDGAEL